MNYETRLFDIREINDLSQEKMAKKLQVARQNYSFWETGTKFIPLKHLNNFCNIFDISMDYILKLNDLKHNNLIKINTLDKKEIGKRIKEIRIKNNVTQKELANILNTTQSTISAYEAGKTLVITSFAYQICKYFNISLDWLCGRK